MPQEYYMKTVYKYKRKKGDKFMDKSKKNERKKLIFCFSAAFFSFLYFVLAVLVFNKPDGLLGYTLCMASIITFVGSMIAVARIKSSSLAEAVINFVFCIFDLIFPFL